MIQINEECDDGNALDDGNGCSELCQANNVCGNGIAETAIEACDDGNTTDGDYCSADCMEVTGVCGDEILQTTEDCDDGDNIDSGNGCSALCTNNSQCGDGALESYFEACDDGNTVDDGNGCDETCDRLGTCGDGQVQSYFEACDDGNNSDDDYCDAFCASVTGYCGDGLQQGNEACDDGNTLNGDYCSADCMNVTGSCGDGLLQLNETCDDGGVLVGDGCSNVCGVEPYFACGDTAPSTCERVVFVRETASGAGNGNSWANAYTSLQDAIEKAEEIYGPTATLKFGWLRALIGPPLPQSPSVERTETFELGSEIVLLGGFAGGETNHKSRRPLERETILSGDINFSGNNSGNAFHVVVVENGEAPVIDGFVIEQGNAESSCINCNEKEGGGLLNLGGSPKVFNTVFRNNYAMGNFGYGSAISNLGGAPTFLNVLIHSNQSHTAVVRNYNATVRIH